MDNKIKIVAVFFLAFIFSSCIGWLDDEHFYERKLNSWTNLKYFSTSKIYTGEYVNIYISNNKEWNLDNRYEPLTENSIVEYNPSNPIIHKCIQIVYNNDYILAEGKYQNDTLYYKITPKPQENEVAIIEYLVDTIDEYTFKTLIKKCNDCKKVNADKIRELDRNSLKIDHAGFPTKTVVFFSLILLYIFYKIYKKKKAKKPNRKNGQ